MVRPRHSYHRAVALLLLLALTAVLLAGCRGGKSQTPPATTGAVPTAVATVPSAVVIHP